MSLNVQITEIIPIKFPNIVLTFSQDALHEWITGITIYARTHRGMTNNVTISVRTTGTNTWILTFLINTS